MGVPMHAGTLAFDDWAPGDVMMTNDPYTTGGMVMHLNDIYLFKPIYVDGRLLCFAWAFIHCTDVGGYAPGSIDMRNNEVFQEGLRLRPVRLMRAGKAEPGTVEHLRRQLPHPYLNWGDITACIAALDKAERRLASSGRTLWPHRRAAGDLRHARSHRTTRPPGPVAHSRGRVHASTNISRTITSATLPVRITARMIAPATGR